MVPNDEDLNNVRCMELIVVPNDVELNNLRMELILVPNDEDLNMFGAGVDSGTKR